MVHNVLQSDKRYRRAGTRQSYADVFDPSDAKSFRRPCGDDDETEHELPEERMIYHRTSHPFHHISILDTRASWILERDKFIMRTSTWRSILVLFFCHQCRAYVSTRNRHQFGMLSSTQAVDGSHYMVKSNVEEYKNAATKILSNFMQKDSMVTAADPLADIDFNAPKIPATTSLETLVAALDYELIEKEWFVTGNVNPCYFSEDFEFQDPDVQLKGIKEYALGVRKLFDQMTSRAQIISTEINTSASTPEAPVITCTWRLSGAVNIAYGLTIKPYIVYTDFTIDPKTSLITLQEDRFSLPPWDILLRYKPTDLLVPEKAWRLRLV